MNWIVVYYHYGKDSYEFKQHVKRNADFMWMGPEGMMMNGTNGSQLWDATFIAQACAEAKLADNPQYRDNMINTLKFIELSQVRFFSFLSRSFIHFLKKKNIDSSRST